MKRIFYYFKIWLLMSRNSFLVWLSQKFIFAIFLVGKLIRFFFFFTFIILITKGAKQIAGYDVNQIIFFFLTFSLIDITSQFLFREVYRFRPLIVSGDFDLVLTKPMNSLFRSLFGGADLVDLVTIPSLVWGIFYFGSFLNPTPTHVFLYIILIINSFLIVAAFHIVVLSMAIITLEIDHSIMIFRDLTSLGRFPIDIYKEPLKGILTFLVPIGIMMSFPAKAFLGLLSFNGILVTIFVGVLSLILSLNFWKYAIKKYTSASS